MPTLTLPPASGADVGGENYEVSVGNNGRAVALDIATVVPQAGDTIFISGLTATQLVSQMEGSYLCLITSGNTTWKTHSVTGSWVIT